MGHVARINYWRPARSTKRGGWRQSCGIAGFDRYYDAQNMILKGRRHNGWFCCDCLPRPTYHEVAERCKLRPSVGFCQTGRATVYSTHPQPDEPMNSKIGPTAISIGAGDLFISSGLCICYKQSSCGVALNGELYWYFICMALGMYSWNR